MNNEYEREFNKDCKDKKTTARSAKSKRFHCGSRGPVRLPSDNLSKKELRAMNGECITYPSFNKPMTWKQFNNLPDDLAIQYIKSLRKMFNVPDKYIGDMMGVKKSEMSKKMKKLGISLGNKGKGNASKLWDKYGWFSWCGVDMDNEKSDNVFNAEPTDTESTNLKSTDTKPTTDTSNTNTNDYISFDKPLEDVCASNYTPVVPKFGDVTFKGDSINNIMQYMNSILYGARVNLHITWKIVE